MTAIFRPAGPSGAGTWGTAENGAAPAGKGARVYILRTAEGARLSVAVPHGQDRLAWALEALLRAGARGITPLSHPAPRWSAYVFDLRALGLPIETIRERHGGEFPGHHGRYVLHASAEAGGNHGAEA